MIKITTARPESGVTKAKKYENQRENNNDLW